jgi:hypothetical protein
MKKLLSLFALLTFLCLPATATQVRGTLLGGDGKPLVAGRLQFVLMGCVAPNTAYVVGFPGKPITYTKFVNAGPGGVLIDQVIGNDQILCGGVTSTWWHVTPYVGTQPSDSGTADYLVTGGQWNYNSASTMGFTPGTVPPTALLTNSILSQTLTQPGGTTLNIIGNVAFSGGSVTFSSPVTVSCGGSSHFIYYDASSTTYKCALATAVIVDADNHASLSITQGIFKTYGGTGSLATVNPLTSDVRGVSTSEYLFLGLVAGDSTSPYFSVSSAGLAVGHIAHGGGGEESGFGITSTANGTIAAGSPVKIDPSTTNRVIATVTSDTGNRAAIGVAARSATVGVKVPVILYGYSSDILSDNSCSVNDFEIISTTVNSKVHCQASYSANAVGRALGSGTTPTSVIFPQ